MTCMAYKYREKVVVPPLEMVDDVLTISKCGPTSIAMNALVNSFMSSKKIKGPMDLGKYGFSSD